MPAAAARRRISPLAGRVGRKQDRGDAIRWIRDRMPRFRPEERDALNRELFAAYSAAAPGDRPAIARRLVEANMGLVVRTAARVAGWIGVDAQDVLGAAVAGFYDGLEKYDPGRRTAPITYVAWRVYAVALSEARRIKGSRAPGRRAIPPDPTPLAPAGEGPDSLEGRIVAVPQPPGRHAAADLVADALESLGSACGGRGERAARVVRLRHLAEPRHDFGEIARALGLSVYGAKDLHRRGLAAMRCYLESRGLDASLEFPTPECED